MIQSNENVINLKCNCSNIIVLLRDVFHIGLVIGPRPVVLAWGAAERQYSRPRTYDEANMKKHHVMIPLLINQSNISRDFSLQLSKRLADSDLAVIGLTGNGTIRKIAVLDWFLLYWPNESFYIVLTDLIIKRLINQS